MKFPVLWEREVIGKNPSGSFPELELRTQQMRLCDEIPVVSGLFESTVLTVP